MGIKEESENRRLKKLKKKSLKMKHNVREIINDV